MQEAKFLGNLLPSSPDFLPIIKAVREKYNVPEISPDDEPIKEIYLRDEIISLEDFRDEIESLVRDNLNLLPPDTANLYTIAKNTLGKPADMTAFQDYPPEITTSIEGIYALSQKMMQPFVSGIDKFFAAVSNVLYAYLLTGESEEIPSDWLSIVATMDNNGEKLVIAMANQLSNQDVLVAQFRQELKKTFGTQKPKLTPKVVNTAHYMALQRAGKRWGDIVEEFIRLNKFSMPRDKNSQKYLDTWKLYSQRLRKNIQRSETILEVLLMDKK